MTTSGEVPYHLLVGARTGFLATAQPNVPIVTPIAEEIPMDAKSLDLVDIGGSPMPTRNRGRAQVKQFIEKKLTVQPLDWDITVSISYNAVQDDRTGELNRKVRAAGNNFRLDMSQKAYQALNDGDATTNFGACYDGGAFYANSHIDQGAAYQTGQDNLDSLALSLTNFETVRVKAMQARDDQGNFTDYAYDLIVVSPADERNAAQICNNREDSTTANRAINPYAGQLTYKVSTQFDSGAWVLVASSAPIKPIIIIVREVPNLQAAWFDPNAADGGMYYFKFYGRYNHYYGDWRLAWMGKS
jgi:phage major head subunit gpT-like protein